MSPPMRSLSRILLAAPLLILLAGCGALERVGMRLLFDPTQWPEQRVLEDVSYGEQDAEKQRFDLFLPEGEQWPTLIFVHGGSWREGDKDLQVGGREVYGNIGRFYASKGLGVAVISYRLQPAVDWRAQVQDVALAVRRVAETVPEHGGDPAAIFLSGHSAGAQLVTYAALADWPLAAERRRTICGVVAVSGAGYDLADEETYSLGADRSFYESTFAAGEPDWQKEASALAFLGDGFSSQSTPPFLVFFAEKEHAALHRQAALLHQAALSSGAPSRLVEVPDVGHRRIVVELSQEDAVLAPEVIGFIETHRRCAAAPSAP